MLMVSESISTCGQSFINKDIGFLIQSYQLKVSFFFIPSFPFKGHI